MFYLLRGWYQPWQLLMPHKLSICLFRSTGLIQARCDWSASILAQIAAWEWGSARVEVGMRPEVEIQRGIDTLLLCKKGLGHWIRIKCWEVTESCQSFCALVRCQGDKKETETKGLAKQGKDTWPNESVLFQTHFPSSSHLMLPSTYSLLKTHWQYRAVPKPSLQFHIVHMLTRVLLK